MSRRHRSMFERRARHAHRNSAEARRAIADGCNAIGLAEPPGQPYDCRACFTFTGDDDTMTAQSGSATITWTDPTVSGTQLPLAGLTVMMNDLVAGTSTQVGVVQPGVQTFTTGFALNPGGRFSFQVKASDQAGTFGPLSTASNEIDVPAAPPADPPGAPTGVSATLNP